MIIVYDSAKELYKLADIHGDLTPAMFESVRICGQGDYVILSEGNGDFILDKDTILSCAGNEKLLNNAIAKAGKYDMISFVKMRKNEYLFKLYMANQGVYSIKKPALKHLEKTI